jgi:RNA polymerase sigma factor for flagellar operon FliA
MSITAIVEPPMASGEVHPTVRELWQRYHKTSDSPAENALVEKYLPLVRSALGRLAITLPEHVDQDDLNSAGLLGLLQALRNYDPACGSSFENYARLRVRGAMLDELRRMDWVPRTVHEKARKIQDTIAQVEQRLGRIPSEAEVAKALNISITEYSDLLAEIRPATFVCLDATCNLEGGDAGSLRDVIADPEADGPLEQVSRNELKQIILNRLRELPGPQGKVLALYYGQDLHLREIAELLGLTESRICQIHSQAILSIRAYVQRLEACQPTLFSTKRANASGASSFKTASQLVS